MTDKLEKKENDADADTDNVVKAMNDKLDAICSDAAEKAANAVIDKFSKSRPSIQVGAEPFENSGGFRNIGEMAINIYHAGDMNSRKRVESNEKLEKCGKMLMGKASGMYDDGGSSGGYLVPDVFSNQIFDILKNVGVIYDKMRKSPSSVPGNTVVVPSFSNDYNSPGLYATVIAIGAEGTQVTNTKPTVAQRSVTINRLFAITYASDELLADAPLLASKLINYSGRSFGLTLDKELVSNTNSLFSVGFVGAGSQIEVERSTGSQVSLTDLTTMYGRLAPGFEDGAFWVMSPTAYAYILNTSNQTVGGGAITYNNATKELIIFGIPVVKSVAAGALGSDADVILIAPALYEIVTKGTFETATSIHLKFDYGEQTFRSTMRVGGNELIAAPINDASTTYSGIITLGYTT